MSSYESAIASLVALAEKQYGLVSLRQLKRAGVEGAGRRWAIDGQLLSTVQAEVYAMAGSPPGRARDVMAAVLAAQPGAWVSHATAAELYGWRLPKYSKRDAIELTIRRGRTPEIERVEIHRTLHLARNEVMRLESIPLTSRARTIVDLSGRLGPVALGRLVDEVVLAKQATIGEIAAINERLPRARGRAKVKLRKILAARADLDEYETLLEVFMYEALKRFGVELPEPQVWVWANGEHYRLDGLYYRERPLVLEADGWAFHRTRTKFDADHRKDRDLREAGYEVLRFTSKDSDWEIARRVCKALGRPIPPQPRNGGRTYYEWKRRRYQIGMARSVSS